MGGGGGKGGRRGENSTTSFKGSAVEYQFQQGVYMGLNNYNLFFDKICVLSPVSLNVKKILKSLLTFFN